jgi:hypothetical protein
MARCEDGDVSGTRTRPNTANAPGAQAGEMHCVERDVHLCLYWSWVC